MSVDRRLAAIDIGTVTTRLLVADVGPEGLAEVARSTDITHLGEGLAASGRLSDAAMRRVADVVAGYVRRIGELGATSTIALATSASRDAENGVEFSALLAEAGVTIRIIPGEEEARLSFLGATYSLPGDGLLVVDVGGGSTELVLGEARVGEDGAPEARIESARSIDVGSRRITELFLRSDPPSAAELDEARAYVTAELRPYFDGLRTRPREMVALAGAATTLSAIHLGLVHYDPERVHMSELSGSDLVELTSHLASLPLARRLEVVGLHPDRAPVIVAGALILETALALSGLDATLVSEHDILYGILLDACRDLQ